MIRGSVGRTFHLERSEVKRYRLVFRDGSGGHHVVHLHSHMLEATRGGKTEISGLFKDVSM